MGWSCTAKAHFTLDALKEILRGNLNSSNSIESLRVGGHFGFWECGREQPDGSITGTVWKPWETDPTRVTKAGSFKIDPEGKVLRFPGTSKEVRAEAEAKGMAEYLRVYGPDMTYNIP